MIQLLLLKSKYTRIQLIDVGYDTNIGLESTRPLLAIGSLEIIEPSAFCDI